MKEIILELIKFVGILASVLLSIHIFKRQSWSKLVSESRNKWLDDLRNDLATLIGALDSLGDINTNYTTITDKERLDLSYKANKAKADVLLKLNNIKYIDNYNENKLFIMLSDLDIKYNMNKNKDIINEIIDYSKPILKCEWEKVKEEA